MKIKDLSPELQEKAIANYLNPEVSGRVDAIREDAINTGLIGAFTWSKSPEGFEFWEKIWWEQSPPSFSGDEGEE